MGGSSSRRDGKAVSNSSSASSSSSSNQHKASVSSSSSSSSSVGVSRSGNSSTNTSGLRGKGGDVRSANHHTPSATTTTSTTTTTTTTSWSSSSGGYGSTGSSKAAAVIQSSSIPSASSTIDTGTTLRAPAANSANLSPSADSSSSGYNDNITVLSKKAKTALAEFYSTHLFDEFALTLKELNPLPALLADIVKVLLYALYVLWVWKCHVCRCSVNYPASILHFHHQLFLCTTSHHHHHSFMYIILISFIPHLFTRISFA
jgi:hypothetical protein